MLPSSGNVSAAIAEARIRGTVDAIVRAQAQARRPSQAQPGKAKICAVDTLRNTSSDSAAAPTRATMIVAQFLRSAASAQSSQARNASARPSSDGTTPWIKSYGLAAIHGGT